MMIQMTDKALYVLVLLLLGACMTYKYMSIVYSVHKEGERQKKLDKLLEAYFAYLERSKEGRKHELIEKAQENLNLLSRARMGLLCEQMLPEPNKN